MQNQESIEIAPVTNSENELSAFGVRVQQTMTTPSRLGKKPRPVWVVSGNTFGLETSFRENGGRKFRGAWSFFNDPSCEILSELNKNGRQSYAEQVESTLLRKEARIERFEGYSENAEARAESASRRADSIASMIPMGQPILLSHHSERRHRRDLDRIGSGMRKSIEESKKSEYCAHKSDSLGYQVARASESRAYIGNRVEEAIKQLAELNRWAEESLSNGNQLDLHQRIARATEKLEFWRGRLKELETKIIEDGGKVASPETIRVGDLVYFHGWLPVVRVNKKTVTVSHWLGIATMTYKIEYTKIKDVKQKPAT